jgi:hypothetical protein
MSKRRSRRHRAQSADRPFSVEPLEARRMLHGFGGATVVLNGNVLEITGDKHPNIIELTKSGSDKVVLEIDGEQDPTNPAGYDLTVVQQIRVDGSSGNDQIIVDANLTVPCQLLGGKGNDTITAGSGDDTVDGGVGNDSIRGGPGNDWLLGGTKNDVLFGEDGDDVINGGTGNDAFDGGAGDDMLQSDLRRETVTGGADSDVFAPLGKSGSRTDFNSSEDLDAGALVTTGAFTDSSLLGTRTDLLPSAPDVNDRHHTIGSVDYAALGFTNPPTYGPHHARFSSKKDRGAPVQPTGVYITEIDDADIVHNLEHGHVWLSYDPALLSASDVGKLQALVATFGGSRHGILLTPRTANVDAVAAVSWAHLMTFSGLDLDAIAQFIITNRGHGPEGFITP